MIEIIIDPSKLKRTLDREETHGVEKERRFQELKEKLKQANLRRLNEMDKDVGKKKRGEYARSSKPVKEEPIRKRIIARRSPEGTEPPWKRRKQGQLEEKE